MNFIELEIYKEVLHTETEKEMISACMGDHRIKVFDGSGVLC